jgi:acyl carrier protein
METTLAEKRNSASRIREFVMQSFPLARKRSITEGTDLLETGIIDSLGVLDLVGFLQQEFAITVDDGDLTAENFRSIACMAQFLERMLDLQDGSARSAEPGA